MAIADCLPPAIRYLTHHILAKRALTASLTTPAAIEETFTITN
jgi:hypothetical protein